MKLAVIPEGALQGFTDEVFDMDHAEYREEIAVDVPGEETDVLGETPGSSARNCVRSFTTANSTRRTSG